MWRPISRHADHSRHPSFPWQEEALSVATHKPNVYIDMSGWSPKYFPPILIRYANTMLKHKMLFGSIARSLRTGGSRISRHRYRDDSPSADPQGNARRLLKALDLSTR